MKLGTGPEHDLHLLDLAAVAGQDVVDPAAYDATAELGERPAEVDALAKDRLRRCWNAIWSGPNSCRLAMARRACRPRRISVVAVNSAWPPSTTLAEGTSSSMNAASAPSPTSTMVRAWMARPGAPTAQRTTTGAARSAPAGMRTSTPWFQAARLAARACRRSAASQRRPGAGGAVAGSPLITAPSGSSVTPARREDSSRATTSMVSSENEAKQAVPSGRSAAAVDAGRFAAPRWRERPRARRRAGRCTAYRAGSSRSAGRGTPRALPGDRRRASPGSSAARRSTSSSSRR